MKVSIIGDYASLSKKIGKELSNRSYVVEYFMQDNIYADLPENYHKLGSVQSSLFFNYIRTGFWTYIGRIFKKSDIQFINGTYPKCVQAPKTCYYYVGSDLRLGLTKPHYPALVCLKELHDYTEESDFLQRVIDPEAYYPIAEVKEKKETYKDDNGIDYIIGHFAHNPEIKGSAKLQQAVDNIMQEEGINIEFINKAIPKSEMLKTMNSCDFILDHLNPKTGRSYNVLALEALLCEVPVGTYYEEKYFDFEDMKKLVHYLDPHEGETEKTLLALLKSGVKINREDVIKYHGPKAVVDVLESIWERWEFI